MKKIWIVAIGLLFLLSSGFVTMGTAQNTDASVGDGAIAEKARESVSKGLEWLRAQQMDDGSWMSNVGITAMGVMAFANFGINEEDKVVSDAVNYLLGKRGPDGSFTTGTYIAYETSLCVVALTATRNPDYKDEVEGAIEWLEQAQQTGENADDPEWWIGGIGYGVDGRPDLSNNQFAVMAFHAASTVYDIEVSESTWENIETFTTRCQNKKDTNPDWATYDDGGFMYYPGYSHAGEDVSYGSMTAAGVWCYVLGGVSREDARVTSAINWLGEHHTFTENPGIGDLGLFYYYWTYARAMTLCGESLINGNNWYSDLGSAILERQSEDGSWVNEKDFWMEGLPVLATVYAINALETRLLPWADGVTVEIELHSDKNLHVLDGEGHHSGDGIMTRSSCEEGIPGSEVTTGDGFTKVVIRNADAGVYKIGMTEGDEDGYDLKIIVKRDGEVLDEKRYSKETSDDVETNLVINSIAAPGSIYLEEPATGESIDPDDYEYPDEKEERSYTPFIIGAIAVLVLLVILSLIFLKRK